MEKKKEVKSTGRWLYRTETGRWITAAILSALMIAAVYLIIRPVFMTIDDARLKYIYAGYSTGKPVSLYLFCYYPLSWILSALYTALPGINWYAVYQFSLIGFASILLGKTVYKICFRRRISFWVALLLHGILYSSVALISTIIMHFEITAGVIGMGGLAVFCAVDDDEDSKPVRILDSVLAVICITASFVIQFNAFYAAACYLLVVLVFVMLRAYKNHSFRRTLTRVLAVCLCLVVLVVGIKVTDGILKDTNGWQEYLEYNKYRVPFWDYPHVTYDEDPALFESMGWSREFYTATQRMYFIDERFCKENLSQIVDEFSWLDFEEPSVMLSTLKDTIGGLYRDESLVVLQTVIFGLLTLLTLLLSLSAMNWRRYYPQLAALWCCIGGTVLLVVFLSSRGRFPLRAWLAVAVPCIVIMSLLLISTRTIYKRVRRRRVRTVTGWCAAGILLFSWVGGMCWVYRDVIRNDWVWRANYNTMTLAMENYVSHHPENFYVYDLMGAQNYSVSSMYPDEACRPSNALVWGSSYINTPAYNDQLRRNGLEHLSTEDLYTDGIYFISHRSHVDDNILLDMLNRDFYPTQLVKVDTIEDYFYVYKVQKIPEGVG